MTIEIAEQSPVKIRSGMAPQAFSCLQVFRLLHRDLQAALEELKNTNIYQGEQATAAYWLERVHAADRMWRQAGNAIENILWGRDVISRGDKGARPLIEAAACLQDLVTYRADFLAAAGYRREAAEARNRPVIVRHWRKIEDDLVSITHLAQQALGLTAVEHPVVADPVNVGRVHLQALLCRTEAFSLDEQLVLAIQRAFSEACSRTAAE